MDFLDCQLAWMEKCLENSSGMLPGETAKGVSKDNWSVGVDGDLRGRIDLSGQCSTGPDGTKGRRGTGAHMCTSSSLFFFGTGDWTQEHTEPHS